MSRLTAWLKATFSPADLNDWLEGEYGPPWPHPQWWEDPAEVASLVAFMEDHDYAHWNIERAGQQPRLYESTYLMARAEAAEQQQKEL